MEQLSQILTLAKPRCLAEWIDTFRITTDETAEFELSCPACGGKSLYPLGFWDKCPPDPDFLSYPIYLQCAGCDRRDMIFDWHLHGYNSEVENNQPTARSKPPERWRGDDGSPGPWKVIAVLDYEEMSEEDPAHVHNYFSGFTLKTDPDRVVICGFETA